jgi:cytidylate kinase
LDKPKQRVIAIDGPAASGKGTLARKIAETLGYAYLDTGALYRTVARRVLTNGDDPAIADNAIKAAQWLRQNVTADLLADPAIRTDEVSNAAAKIADVQDVRQELLGLQRDFAQNPGETYNGAVLDGRDIGTVICPQADVKLFVTAEVGIRAKRRLKELQSKGIEATYEAVLRDMHTRDARDASRQAAPMKPAEDAIVLDTSDLNADEALEKALEIIKDKLPVAS